MSEIIKFENEKVQKPKQYKITDLDTNETKIVELEADPGTVLTEGTPLSEQYLNNLALNNVYIVDTNKETGLNKDIYIVNLEGIDKFGVVKDLKLKVKIAEDSTQENTVLKINDIEYPVIKNSENGLVTIRSGDLTADNVYNMFFNGSQFIIENGSLPATPDGAGIISISDIQKCIRETEATYVLGSEYGDTFGTTLTSIEKGKVYYYWDSIKQIYIPYLALKNSMKVTGFITPDAFTFVEISNSNNANIVYQDGPYTVKFRPKEGILYVHNNKLNPTYMLTTLESVINRFCTMFSYTVPVSNFMSGFAVYKAGVTWEVYQSYAIYTVNGWVYYASEGNILISGGEYYFHSGEAHVKLEKI